MFVWARPFADRHVFGFRPDQVQHTGPDQCIVEDDIRTPQQPLRLSGQQIRIAGSRPYEPHCAGSEFPIATPHRRNLASRVGPDGFALRIKRIFSLRT
jgi:hypothetical protein